MPRNMSFALTQPQIVTRTKTVTRRFGWSFLKVGDVLNAVDKAMGHKKGSSPKKLALIRVVSIRTEPLSDMEDSDLPLEGFGHMKTKWEFVEMMIKHYSLDHANVPVNRIEFEYIGEREKNQ